MVVIKKIKLISVALLFVFGTIAQADTIYFRDTTLLHGIILSYQTEKLDMVIEHAGFKSIPISQITRINSEAPKRIAILHLSNGEDVTIKNYRIDSQKIIYSKINNQITGIPFTQISTAAFYPVAAISNILQVPYVKELPDYCGEASVAMAAAYFGKKLDQHKINQACEVKENRGAYSRELGIGINNLRLKTKNPYWYADTTESDFYADRNRLIQAIVQNHPVLLGFWYDYTHKKNEKTWAFDHFVLLVGYDLKQKVFIIHDPARKKFWTLSFSEFRKHRETKFNAFYDIEFIGR